MIFFQEMGLMLSPDHQPYITQAICYYNPVLPVETGPPWCQKGYRGSPYAAGIKKATTGLLLPQELVQYS